jgi:hypothetical protein
VRHAALAHPECFRQEHTPMEIDVEWLRDSSRTRRGSIRQRHQGTRCPPRA